MQNEFPLVSVIIPCRNEEKFIGDCLNSIVKQDYPAEKLEVFVVDGMSEDRTRNIVQLFSAKHKNIRLLENQRKITPVALNIGIEESKGDYILRIDAHSFCQRDYVQKCLEYLEKSRADCVGGVLETLPSGKDFVAKAIAKVLSSPFGVGGSTFRTKRKAGYADTVPFGAYRREVFRKVGLFNEKLARNQDNELNKRITRKGGKIFITPEIKLNFYAPNTFRKFFRKQFQNGAWNIYTERIAPNSLRPRHFIPLFFVLGLLGSSVVAIFFPAGRVLFFLLIGIYFLINIIFSLKIAEKDGIEYLAILPLVFFTFHLSYGLGSLWGLTTVFVRFRYA